jgi:hypothetical protein
MKQLLKIFILNKRSKQKAKPYPETFRTVQPKEHAKDYGEWLKYIYLERNRPYRRGL